MRSRLGRMVSLSTALAGFQLPSLPSSRLLSDRHDAETWAITRFASGAPFSFAGFVPVRFAARSLICWWSSMSFAPVSSANGRSSQSARYLVIDGIGRIANLYDVPGGDAAGQEKAHHIDGVGLVGGVEML